MALVTNRDLPTLLAKVEQDSLVSYTAVQHLPPAVATFLATHAHQARMADVGAPFAKTCARDDENLPTRQLVYLGVGQEMVLVSYYCGGFGLSQRVALFQLQGHTLRNAWGGFVTDDPNTKAALLHQIRHRQRTHPLNSGGMLF